jgi:hypothetical protein
MILIIIVLLRKLAQTHTNTAQNKAWTVDPDMSWLASDSEEEVVAETQIILYQLALLITTSSSWRYGEDKKMGN